MSDSQTTAEAVIEGAVMSVCSDGNSDPRRVAKDVVDALRREGWLLVRPTWAVAPDAAASREPPVGYR